ncbi:GspH/FimT family pseudopilin [Pseudomonas stutzeri]|nr:GspH/FimT family pseudopilin [Stutzerimonas stutzeri]
MLGSIRGFTLTEVILALAVLSIGLSIATPAMRQTIHGQQLRQASIDLGMALTRARQEAIMRRRPVVLDNQDGEWSSGWRIFVDHNGNGALDADEPILKIGDAIAKGVRISGNTPVRRYIRYTPTGRTRLQSGALQAGTISLCHESGKQAIRRLVLAASGRVRTEIGAAGSC